MSEKNEAQVRRDEKCPNCGRQVKAYEVCNNFETVTRTIECIGCNYTQMYIRPYIKRA